MRYIDAYNHFFPKRYFDALMQTPAGEKDIGKRVRGIPALFDLDQRRLQGQSRMGKDAREIDQLVEQIEDRRLLGAQPPRELPPAALG